MTLRISAPLPLQVVQRDEVGGTGTLRVRGAGAPVGADRVEVRTVALPEAWGQGTAWTSVPVRVDPAGGFDAVVPVGPGGWFRVDVRFGAGPAADVASVEPVGVGEVFVIAGQSYATSCHERVTTIADPLGRVTSACPESPGWRIAHDPQPAISTRIDADTTAELLEMLAGLDLSFPFGEYTPFRGSIWPATFNALQPLLQVPVGLVQVAVGGTRIGHWRSGTQLFGNLCDAVSLAGDYRAVLWQQGESDVRHGTPTAEYRDALVALRRDLVAHTGLDRPWVVAKSTHHPTAERALDEEERIRSAVDEVWSMPGFVPGPDTDRLRGLGDHRAVMTRGAHFTARGQDAAGEMWAEVLARMLGVTTRTRSGARTP